jgi:thymidine phosphorylase
MRNGKALEKLKEIIERQGGSREAFAALMEGNFAAPKYR